MGLWMSYGCQELAGNNSKPLKPTVFVKYLVKNISFLKKIWIFLKKIYFHKTPERGRIIFNPYQHIYPIADQSEFNLDCLMFYSKAFKMNFYSILNCSKSSSVTMDDALVYILLLPSLFFLSWHFSLACFGTSLSLSVKIFASIYFFTLVSRGITFLDNHSEKLVDGKNSTCLLNTWFLGNEISNDQWKNKVEQ